MITIIIINKVNTNKQFEEANKLLNSGDCEVAENIFKTLLKSDSYSNKIKKCKYDKADEYLKSEDFENAYKLFYEIKGYKDSEANYLKSYYNFSKKQFDEKDYYNSIKSFYNIKDYSDSSEYIEKCKGKLIETAVEGDKVFLGEFEQDGVLDNKELIEWSVLKKMGIIYCLFRITL